MKLIKKASGKQTIKISKKEWQAIGRQAQWSDYLPSISPEEKADLERRRRNLVSLDDLIDKLTYQLDELNNNPSVTPEEIKDKVGKLTHYKLEFQKQHLVYDRLLHSLSISTDETEENPLFVQEEGGEDINGEREERGEELVGDISSYPYEFQDELEQETGDQLKKIKQLLDLN